MAKILFRGFALVVLSVGTANAADLPIGVPVAPPSALIPTTWDGPYVGLNVGGRWLNDRISTTALPTGSTFSGTLNTWGAMGGLQAGYNWQFGNVVAGVEVDANVLGAGSTQTNSALGITDSIKSPGFLLTVRPRLGWAFDHRTLVYGTAGYAFETVQVNDSVIFGGPTSALSDVSGRQSGWTAGGGLEYAFSRGVSAKIEYLYVGLGTVSSLVVPVAGTPFASVNVAHKLSDNIVRAGVNFHLGY
jgi:outer membrane immunogenic protein